MNKFKSAHGTIRGLEAVPSSSQFEGRFGRMFRTLPPAVFMEEDLKSLASVMVAEAEAEQTPETEAGSRRELWHQRGLYISGPIHRSRHHLRPGKQPAKAKRPQRAHRLSHTAIRSRQRLRPRPRRSALPVRGRRGARAARPETDRQFRRPEVP